MGASLASINKELRTLINHPTALVGKQALEHYLVCFQLVLWKQVSWLVSEKGLPAELETIVRDLWTIRLQTLQDKLEEDDTQAEQFFSSQTEAESDQENDTTSGNSGDRPPRVLTGICLSFLGILLLGLPFTTADIHGWISDGGLLYYRAIRTLESGMKVRLPGRYHMLLDPQHALKPERISLALVDTISFFATKVGMAWPSLNTHLCLHRFVCILHLPIETYAATLRLAGLLDIDFSFDPSSVSKQPSASLRSPEARLAALLVVATKLLFPFDNIQRLPKRPTELAALGMDWERWGKIRQRTSMGHDGGAPLRYQQALQTTENDVLNMSEDKLDQYMDWYQRMYVDEEAQETRKLGKEAGFRRAMYRMFPINRTASERDDAEGKEPLIETSLATDSENLLKDVQAALKPLRVLSEEAAAEAHATPDRPGNYYKRHRTVMELHGLTKAFHEDAAKLAGLSLESMLSGVFALEKRLEQWESQARREPQ